MGKEHNYNFESINSFFMSLFRGDISLVRTYWAYSFLPLFILRTMVVFAGQQHVPYIVIALLLCISSVLMLFMAKCIYSSASKYLGFVAWKYLAIFASFLMIVSAIRNVVFVANNFEQIAMTKAVLKNERSNFPKKVNDHITINYTDYDGAKFVYKYSYVIPNAKYYRFNEYVYHMFLHIKKTVCASQDFQDFIYNQKRKIF